MYSRPQPRHYFSHPFPTTSLSSRLWVRDLLRFCIFSTIIAGILVPRKSITERAIQGRCDHRRLLSESSFLGIGILLMASYVAVLEPWASLVSQPLTIASVCSSSARTPLPSVAKGPARMHLGSYIMPMGNTVAFGDFTRGTSPLLRFGGFDIKDILLAYPWQAEL